MIIKLLVAFGATGDLFLGRFIATAVLENEISKKSK
jgi:hypothetical protein